MLFTKQNTPRWLIFFIDIVICIFSVILAYLLRFNFSIPQTELDTLHKVLLFILLVRSISFVIAKTYAGIIRYTTTGDVVRVFIVILLGSVLFSITNIITFYLNAKFFIPFSIIIIDFIATTLTLIGFRVLVKTTYLEIYNTAKQKRNVIIFGAGESGIFAKRALERDAGTKYKVLAFIDNNSKKIGKKLEGITIYSPNKLEELLNANAVAHIILSIQKLNSKRKKEIIETCLSYNTKVLNVPEVSKWINGELSFKQIKKINIEDLLERDVIKINKKQIRKEFIGKNVLITGAAGSIGSELVRQIAVFPFNKLILVDQAESELYNIELELFEKYHSGNFEIALCDIRNKLRMQTVFENFKPDIIYHAAAYKHVPMMENNPYESVFTNIEGTKIIADLAIEHKVKKFVMISTDKAVNPTNVMGASKRIAEIYIQSLNQKNITRFITTRFGNVLGSNGSVIPLFKKQIDKGGPITITHPKVTRYFMTIPESCQLVLEAGSIGKGGEIFIFDMGKSVKIVDVAKKMIKLSGLTLGKDISIVYIGLRPGEKLYEELLNDQENTIPTHYQKIMIAKVKKYELETVSENIDALISLIKIHKDNFKIVKKMKEIVPEFKSQNSVFEKLDVNGN
jgi:FlaA1/EpsC-like NDP-sugar epimerase